jgi:hypothetical protein
MVNFSSDSMNPDRSTVGLGYLPPHPHAMRVDDLGLAGLRGGVLAEVIDSILRRID